MRRLVGALLIRPAVNKRIGCALDPVSADGTIPVSKPSYAAQCLTVSFVSVLAVVARFPGKVINYPIFSRESIEFFYVASA